MWTQARAGTLRSRSVASRGSGAARSWREQAGSTLEAAQRTCSAGTESEFETFETTDDRCLLGAETKSYKSNADLHPSFPWISLRI